MLIICIKHFTGTQRLMFDWIIGEYSIAMLTHRAGDYIWIFFLPPVSQTWTGPLGKASGNNKKILQGSFTFPKNQEKGNSARQKLLDNNHLTPGKLGKETYGTISTPISKGQMKTPDFPSFWTIMSYCLSFVPWKVLEKTEWEAGAIIPV